MTPTEKPKSKTKPWWHDGYTKRQDKIASKDAIKAGCEIVRGTEQILLVDFDSPDREQVLKHLDSTIEKLNIMMPNLGLEKFYFLWNSWSGNHHVKLHCAQKFTIQERLLLEVILGSDPTRASYGLARVYDKEDHGEISKLFRPPGAKIELIHGEEFIKPWGAPSGQDSPF